MIYHKDITPVTLRALIRKGKVCFGGYLPGKIYGRLDCSSGRCMKALNRVFFASEEEALAEGFRPCGNCMKAAYRIWVQRSARLRHK